ncbi:3-hydroxyacyl-CoA dehydrogenase NAD-binding domain-containing protein [Phenylobacterium sp.]|jgi:3-hydroxyacyl-CoA dehydrogenase|uniref:3-hydroxyacyl-CoA dehydrogenase NAD-binding domain-containing protein n=1 Tax=Phenylobacterium sp. TaxID=1871053 RepID=UPI0037843195
MAEINSVTTLVHESQGGVDVAVLTLNSPPVNALSFKVREGLDQGFRQAIESDAKAIVLICEGRTFIAGADISEFSGGMAQGPSLQEIQVLIESSPKPVVAAIHGTALGGGLEVALCANYRIAVPSARVGLPEVKLGLLPGAGGTQRLPRLVGIQKALEMITSGNHVPAAEAHAAGLIDAMAPEGGLREAAIELARRAASEGGAPRRVRDLDDKLAPARSNPEIFATARKMAARAARGAVAPDAAIRAVEAAVTSASFDEGLAEERRLFMELLMGPQSAAQRYYFFAERQAAKIPGASDDTPTRPIAKVGILGAGTMGGGIAMNFANVGIPVTLVEVKAEALERGLGVIRKNYERTAAKGRITAEDVETRMGLITGSLDFAALGDCDLVIEAVFERMDVKKDVFTRLDATCKPGAILATNTSYLNVDEIAAVTKRPQDVVGLHFFSPANVMRLLEIVDGEKTATDVLATAMKLAKQIGKVAVVAGVCHGFIGNRMLAPRQQEAMRLLLEGLMPWDVDRVIYDFGFPMGAFAMSDLAGLDIGWIKEESASRNVREVLAEQGRLGQKTGGGFYDYDADRKATPSPVTEQIVKDFAAKANLPKREISDQEILERCIYPMINEGAKILEEGKAYRASDIDVVWVNGYGWPVYRGGPMYYADQIGLDKVLERLKVYQAQVGEEFKPAALLEQLVAEGKKFSDFKPAAGQKDS